MVWADNDYRYKKKITIDYLKVDGDETDFPVLISVTDTDLQACLANGYDIKFYESTESTQLKHERVFFDNGTGEIVAWVKIPSLSGTVNTIFYIYYKYPGETVDQADTENVWDAHYMMVHHMDGANYGSLLDSTANDNDCVGESGDPTFNQDGHVYKCVQFDGDDYLNMGNDSSLRITKMTLECWVNHGDHAAAFFPVSMPYSSTSFADPYYAYSFQGAVDETYRVIGNVDGVFVGLYDDVSRSLDTWHSFAGSYDGDYFDLYVEGNKVQTSPQTTGSITYVGTPNFVVGQRSIFSPNRYYTGYVEEIRVSDNARSDNWLSTTHNTQDSPSTFMGFGSEETLPPRPTVAVGNPLMF